MIAFIFDDRLPHDRKIQFHRTVTQLKGKFDIEILPNHFKEDELIAHLRKHEYELVLMPWYKYLSWKKIDAFFGSLRMERTAVAGYFADPILAFEFGMMPNYHRHIFLDFYRFEIHDIEMMIQTLTHPKERSGFSMLSKNTPVYHMQWMEKDSASTHCVDEVLALPIFHENQWKSRAASFRFFLTGLWSYVMPEVRLHPGNFSAAEIEVAEFQKRVAIKVLFKNQDYNLKSSMNWMWPNHIPTHPAVREMHAHADFIRIHHYPETNQIEITTFFLLSNPSHLYPNEMRGFWIEPLGVSTLKKYEDHLKRISIKSFLMHQKKKAA